MSPGREIVRSPGRSNRTFRGRPGDVGGGRPRDVLGTNICRLGPLNDNAGGQSEIFVDDNYQPWADDIPDIKPKTDLVLEDIRC